MAYKVGDKVRIIRQSDDDYTVNAVIGSIAEIVGRFDGEHYTIIYESSRNGYGSRGYITRNSIELVSPKPTKNQRISALEKEVETLKAEIDALKATQKTADIAKIAEGFVKMVAKEKKLTPNEQASANEKRKAIIDEAKVFVEELSEIIRGTHKRETKFGRLNDVGYTYALKPEFHINSKKRTITVLMKGGYRDNGKVYAKGIAKCNPSDVFNADIGKAIALGRALGLDVSKFEKAVHPTEYVEGMFVKDISDDIEQLGERDPEEDGQYGKAFNIVGHGYWLGTTQLTQILDDTEAQY